MVNGKDDNYNRDNNKMHIFRCSIILALKKR